MPSHTAAAGRPDSTVSREPCAVGCGCTKALTVVAASSNEDVGMVKKIEHYPELVDLHGATSKNNPRQLRTTKLPSNDSALFPFRFVDVHS
jgi:hypothetical protein